MQAIAVTSTALMLPAGDKKGAGSELCKVAENLQHDVSWTTAHNIYQEQNTLTLWRHLSSESVLLFVDIMWIS